MKPSYMKYRFHGVKPEDFARFCEWFNWLEGEQILTAGNLPDRLHFGNCQNYTVYDQYASGPAAAKQLPEVRVVQLLGGKVCQDDPKSYDNELTLSVEVVVLEWFYVPVLDPDTCEVTRTSEREITTPMFVVDRVHELLGKCAH